MARCGGQSRARRKPAALSEGPGSAISAGVSMLEPDRHPGDRLRRELTLVDATMIVVSSVIGVGIFLTPGAVAEILPHPAWFLAAWLAGGLLSLAGALANAELGAMYPRAGGDYVYLREAYHPLAGFLVGWLSFFVIFAGTVATLATGFAEWLSRFVPLGTGGKLTAAIGITAVASWIHYRGVRAGAQFNNATAYAKIGALAALVLAGPLWGHGDAQHLAALFREPGAFDAGNFGLALSPVLFSYLGWNASVYVASEIRDPGRNVPRSLFAGLTICTAIYLAVNFLYLYALPPGALRGELRVGEAAARALFGPSGGAIAGALVLLSIAGCLNATVLAGPRIAYAMALDALLFPALGKVHPRHGTPHVAIAVQAVAAGLLVLALQSFPSILDYTTFAIVLATTADTAALYALRWRQPARPRPYRAWGYPFVPALYLAANAAIAAAMLRGRPAECAIALAVTLSGVPVYAAFAFRQRHQSASQATPGRD